MTPLEQEEEPLKRPPITLGVFEYFFPKLVWRQGNVIIWRKHWIVLWRTIGWSTLAIFVALLAFGMWFNRTPPVGTLLEDGAWWVWPLLLGGLGAWWWWVFEDWRNDEYMLTGNRVIEINAHAVFAQRETTRIAVVRFSIYRIEDSGAVAKIVSIWYAHYQIARCVRRIQRHRRSGQARRLKSTSG